LPPDDGNDERSACALHGRLKHVEVHPKKDGSFAVHAHYEHARTGHHVVESQQATREQAAEEVQRHLHGHEIRRQGKQESAEEESESAG
jgi:hypothetical protein